MAVPEEGRTPGDDGPMELSVVQKWFYSVVTHPDGVDVGAASPEAIALAPTTREGLERMVTRSRKVSARDRLAIYGNAYFARLVECLSDAFPVLRKLVGEEAFTGFAFEYLQRYPSRSYTLARLGEHFADYLRETRPPSEKTEAAEGGTVDWARFMIELAELEWTIADVFDGPGLERERAAEAPLLGEVAPGRWADVRLRMNPALRLLAFRFPVNEYYTAARRNSERVPLPSAGDTYVAISRRDYVVRRHAIRRAQYVLLNALKEGATIGEGLERAAWSSGLDDDALARELHHWFRDWSRYRFIAGVEVG